MNSPNPVQREVMRAHTLLDEGFELTASRRIPSGWRRQGRGAVLRAVDYDRAAAVIDALEDEYYVRPERTGRVLTPEPAREENAMPCPSPAPEETEETEETSQTEETAQTTGELVSETWVSVRWITDRAECSKYKVHARIKDGTFDARLVDGWGGKQWKIRMTDEVRILCGMMYRKVVSLDEPWYDIDDLVVMLDRCRQTLYAKWQCLTQVENPTDRRRVIALTDDALVDFLDEHDVRGIPDTRFYPVTPTKVDRIVRYYRLDRQAA